jgi:hypothetical protein
VSGVSWPAAGAGLEWPGVCVKPEMMQMVFALPVFRPVSAAGALPAGPLL